MKASASSFLCFAVLTANKMGMLQDYSKINWKWTGERTGTPYWSSATTGGKEPPGELPALPDGEDGFTSAWESSALLTVP